MEATILFPEINLFDSSISRITQWISRSKRRRLNKKAKRKKTEKEGAAKSDPSPSFFKEPPSGVADTITKPADGGRGRSDWQQPSDVPLPAKTGLLCESCQHLLDEQSTVPLAGSLQALLPDVLEEGETTVRNPVSVDGFSLSFEGMSPAIVVDEAVKKRKSEPNQLSDVLPVVEDEDPVKRKSVSPSELLSPLVAVHTIVAEKSSLMPLYLTSAFSACTQASSDPPGSDLFDDEGPLCSDVHCSVETRLGAKNLKQVRDGIDIESGFGLVAPRLKRKTRSKSIADGHRYNFRLRLKKD